MDFKDLTPGQIQKAKGMSVEELHRFAAEEGMALTDEELEQVAGGWGDDSACPSGGEHDWDQTDTDFSPSTVAIPIYTCTKCGATHRGPIS